MGYEFHAKCVEEQGRRNRSSWVGRVAYLAGGFFFGLAATTVLGYAILSSNAKYERAADRFSLTASGYHPCSITAPSDITLRDVAVDMIEENPDLLRGPVDDVGSLTDILKSINRDTEIKDDTQIIVAGQEFTTLSRDCALANK